MATIVTRAGKGSPLTNTEVDANFTNLNTDKAELSGATFTGEITANAGIALPDSQKATFGAGDDLQIYHDPSGPSSIISDQGAGDLILRGSNQIRFQDATGGEHYAIFNENGAVQLNYDNAAKLATTATGIDVTGSVVADGLTVDDGASDLRLDSTEVYSSTAENTSQLKVKNWDTTTAYTPSVLSLQARGSTTTTSNWQLGNAGLNTAYSESDFFIKNRIGSSGFRQRLLIEGNGNLSLYEDTGTTAKMVWDASAERLGIGTSSPARTLEVNAGSTQVATVIGNTNGTRVRLTFKDANTTNDSQVGVGAEGNELIAHAGGAERMRIDSSGNVLVGVTSAGADGGVSISSTGYIQARIDNDIVAYFDRTGAGDDGEIVRLQQNGTVVGSIGTKSGNLFIGSTNGSDGHLTFGSNIVFPADSNGDGKDNAIDLGASWGRFKDLYLSGAAFANYVGSASDTNTNIAFDTSDTIRFTNGASERMRIDSSGNVNIGTSLSAAKLHTASGVARTSTAKTETAFFSSTDNDDFRFGLAVSHKGGATDADRYASLDSTAYRISTDTFAAGGSLVLQELGGNVGIGTSTVGQFESIDVGLTVDSGNAYSGIAMTDGATTSTLSQGYSTTYLYNQANGSMLFGTNNTERMRIRSDGTVSIIGAGNTAGGNLALGDTDDGRAKWSYITGAHYNAATETEGVAMIGVFGDDGNSSVVIGGSIYEANPATSIKFYTHTASTHGVGGTQQATIDSTGNLTLNNGNLVINTAGKGIFFGGAAGAGGMTSQLLDDYEEGTFSPVFTIPSGSVTYNAGTGGVYTKIGRMVHVNAWIYVGALSSPSGTLTLALPFANAGNARASQITVVNRWTSVTGQIGCWLSNNSTSLNFVVVDNGTMFGSALNGTNMQTNCEMYLNFSYETA